MGQEYAFSMEDPDDDGYYDGDENVGEIGDKCEALNCNGHMVLRNGRYGEFLGCSNYPKCTNTKKLF